MRKAMPGKFLTKVYEAALSHGRESRKCIDLLRTGKIDWGDEDALKPVALEFRLGHIAGYLSLPTREDALVIADLSAKERTAEQQRAYRAAISAWSYVKLIAGAPNELTGAPRAPQAASRQEPANGNTPASTVAVPPNSPQALLRVLSSVFPRVSAPEDVGAFASWLVATIEAFEARNIKVRMGEYRPIFHTFIASVKAIQKASAKAA